MANGKLRSMKREIEGKILSEVSGTFDTAEATAKELKATNTARILSVPLENRLEIPTRYAAPERGV